MSTNSDQHSNRQFGGKCILTLFYVFLFVLKLLVLNYILIFYLSFSTFKKTYKFVRQLLSLPYVPDEHVGLFLKFYRKAVGSQPLLNLLEYVNTTWIRSDTASQSLVCI